MNRHRSSLLLFVLILTGCSVVTRNAASGRFKDAIEENTRHISIERDFSIVLSMDIVHMNQDVRTAYVDEYAKHYLLPDAEKEKMLRQQATENVTYDAFYLIMYTAPGIDSSLGGPDSVWKIYAEYGGKIESPVSLEEVTSQRDLLKGFMPWISSWDRVYVVKFDRGGSAVNVIVTGILGKGEANF